MELFFKLPDPPQIYVVMDDPGGDPVRAFLDEAKAEAYCKQLNGTETEPGIEQYSVEKVIVVADEADWRARCSVCKTIQDLWKGDQ